MIWGQGETSASAISGGKRKLARSTRPLKLKSRVTASRWCACGRKNKLMKLPQSTAQIFVPDGKPVAEALKRITHLGVGAHQDDLEFLAFHGILECFASETKWFGGVTCTNGAGSSRTGAYEKYTDAQMMGVRRTEQNTAATIGQYGVMFQLDYSSSAIKSPTDLTLKNDLKEIIVATRISFRSFFSVRSVGLLI